MALPVNELEAFLYNTSKTGKMTIEEQPSQRQKHGSEAAIPYHVNDDDDYYDIDPELARNRSKLRVLFHCEYALVLPTS